MSRDHEALGIDPVPALCYATQNHGTRCGAVLNRPCPDQAAEDKKQLLQPE